MFVSYTLFGVKVEALKAKPAFIDGFLALPKMSLIVMIIVGVLWVLLQVLIGTIHLAEWIFLNMP
jgi:hypothetical protein